MAEANVNLFGNGTGIENLLPICEVPLSLASQHASLSGQQPSDSGLQEPSGNNALDQEVSGQNTAACESAEGASSGRGSRRSQEQLLKNRSAQRRFRERQKNRIIELEEWTSQLDKQIKILKEDKETLEARNTVLVRLAEQKTWQVEQAKIAGFDTDDNAYIFTDILELTLNKEQPLFLSQDQVRTLNRADLVKIWKEYVHRLSNCLADTDLKGEKIQAELGRLTSELVMLLLRVALCSPLVLKAFAARNMETNSMQEDDLESLYHKIVIDLDLSASQKQDMIQLRQLFTTQQFEICKQRSDVVLLLVDLQNTASSLGSERRSSQAHLQAHEAMMAMRASAQEEHSLRLDFMTDVFKNMLRPQQLAQVMVQTYPWFPDTLALTSIVAAQAGDAQAAMFFRAQALRHISSNSGLSGFALSRGGSVRSQLSGGGGGIQSNGVHTSAGVFQNLQSIQAGRRSFSGQSGMHSPVNSPLGTLSAPAVSLPSPRFASQSPVNSPRFVSERISQDHRDLRNLQNPFADSLNGPSWGFGYQQG